MEKRVLIDEQTLQTRIRQLGKQITEDYKGEKVTLLCILKGSAIFFADLARRIKLDAELEFVRISSYAGTDSTGTITVRTRPDQPLTGKNVIVFEDIIDTGYTLSYYQKELLKEHPKSLRICTLLDKPERREVDDVFVDYVGFTIPNRFVIGYGLDLDQQYRNLPEVYCMINEDEEQQVVEDANALKLQLIRKEDKKENA